VSKIFFLIGIHNHQPVGNFGHVFHEAFENCYSPLLEALSRYPDVRFSIHHTGPLLEWIKENRPEYIEKLRALVADKRVEILGGGFYEPILSVLPERDAVGQLEMMNEWAEENLGQRPRGAWLAERIWDPAIPRVLDGAGLEYTLLDDTHFHYASLSDEDMHGYYVTERHGHTTAIFPIDKFLRYSIPFKQPEETLDYFRGIAEKHGATSVTYGDDGEKLGLWPETYDWVYNKKWLERFLEMLENNRDLIETITFSEYLDRFPPRGRVYLPMASYEEMGHWALPVHAAGRFREIVEEVKESDKANSYAPFLRGGLWDNFLVKYEESNRLHKRMLYVSRRVKEALSETADEKLLEEMHRELYRGQCNCPYWHGLFGGLYLSNLRHANYSSLIKAGRSADIALRGDGRWLEVKRDDFFKSHTKSAVVETADLFVLIDPAYGGTVAEIDYKPAAFNITNVLTRRPEEYHRKIMEAVENSDGAENEILSPHDRVALKEEGLDDKLIFDNYLRSSFIDHFLDSVPDAELFRHSSVEEKGDFLGAGYALVSASEENGIGAVLLEREGHIETDGGTAPLKLQKRFEIDPERSEIVCRYSIENLGREPVGFVFGVEWNFTLLAADAEDRYLTIDGERHKMNSEENLENVTDWAMTDEHFRFAVECHSDEPVTLARYPVETVSQSEGGFESNYQGTAFIALSPMYIEPSASVVREFRVAVKRI